VKLKLAMVSPFPEQPGVITGGVEAVAHCLIEGLRSVEEMEIHVVAPCLSRLPGVETRDGVTIHWLKLSRIPAFLSYWSLFRKDIHRCLEVLQPDLTHFQGVSGWMLNYRKPAVLTVHGIYEKDILYSDKPFASLRGAVIGQVERRGRRKSRHTVLINPYVLDEIGCQLPGNNVLIENPVTDDFFEVRRAIAEPRLLFAGRICQRKNVHGLLRLFARVHREIPAATLHIAGLPESAAYDRECRTIVSDHGLGDAVSFLGNISRRQLLTELSQASSLVLISWQDTAPMIVEEAMAAGVPVVVSRNCGLPYMVEEGITGHLVDPEAEESNAELLTRLLQDPKVIGAMGARGREAAKARFHAKGVALKTLRLYREILEAEEKSKKQP
jgi:glycosyltransferase involved in cell wall biosynthesis